MHTEVISDVNVFHSKLDLKQRTMNVKNYNIYTQNGD